MTISSSESWSLPFSSQSIAASVRISPTRRRLDRQSPTLAFTVGTSKAFVEVILTTRPELFEPARAGERTPQTFFASRAFGLSPTHGGEATYFVPAAALHALLAGGAARQIYYTAVGYDDATARGAVVAHSPAELARSAPSVQVEAGFGATELTRAFGTSLERLLRPGTPYGAQSSEPSRSVAESAGEAPWAGAATRWTGVGQVQIPEVRIDAGAQELDGFALSEEPDADGFERDADAYAGASSENWGYRTFEHEPAAHIHDRGYDDDHDHVDVYGDDVSGGGAAASLGEGPDVDYDDGYGEDDRGHGEQASFGRGRGPEPAELLDAEDDGTGYGDESEAAVALEQPAAAAPIRPPPAPSPAEQRAIFEEVAKGLGEAPSLYETARPTDEGLSFGVGAFTQASGALGRLLELMRARDAAELARIFGPHTDALLATLTAPSRNERLAAVGGAALGDPVWLQRFARSGDREHLAFRGAQNELLSTAVFAPLWPVAWGLGLTSDRALAVVTALGIHRGAEATADWIVARVGPTQAGPQIQRALAALGATDLAAFQARAGLPATSTLDARTHAALTYALRGLGDRSPVSVLAPAQMLDAIVRHLEAGGIGRKIAELIASPALSDRVR